MFRVFFFIFAFFGAFTQLSHIAGAEEPRFAEEAKPATLLRTLSWYSRFALGALQAGPQNQVGKEPETIARLSSANILDSQTCQVLPEYRSSVWWIDGSRGFVIPIFSIRVERVISTAPVQPVDATLQKALEVEFEFTPTDFSPAFIQLSQQSEREALQQQIGQHSIARVIFSPSFYGYYLPLRQPPNNLLCHRVE